MFQSNSAAACNFSNAISPVPSGQLADYSSLGVVVISPESHVGSYLGVAMSSEADSTTDREGSTRSFDPLSNQLLGTSPRRDMARNAILKI